VSLAIFADSCNQIENLGLAALDHTWGSLELIARDGEISPRAVDLDSVATTAATLGQGRFHQNVKTFTRR
jgi:hypothetical protein